jgi:CRP-like cAMP-binding protein
MELLKKQPDEHFAAGDVIFQAGDKGSVMYGIIEGEVELAVDGTVVETITTGDIFGQGALVQLDASRASTATAKTPCTLAVMDLPHFLFAIEQTPLFAVEVMRSFSTRLRNLKNGN